MRVEAVVMISFDVDPILDMYLLDSSSSISTTVIYIYIYIYIYSGMDAIRGGSTDKTTM